MHHVYTNNCGASSVTAGFRKTWRATSPSRNKQSTPSSRIRYPTNRAEKFAAFTYLHNDAQNPICGTAHNVSSPEMLYITAAAARSLTNEHGSFVLSDGHIRALKKTGIRETPDTAGRICRDWGAKAVVSCGTQCIHRLHSGCSHPRRFSLRQHDIAEWRDLLLRERGRVIKAGQNIFARDVGIGPQKRLDAVAVRKHPHDLMHGNARPGDAGLPVTDSRINRDTSVHVANVSRNPPLLKHRPVHGPAPNR